MFWMFERATPHLGIAWPLVVLKVMASGSALAAIWGAKRKGSTPPTADVSRKEVWVLALGVALSDSLAWVAWIYGQRASYTSVATALASLFSVVTVVLAAILLRER